MYNFNYQILKSINKWNELWTIYTIKEKFIWMYWIIRYKDFNIKLYEIVIYNTWNEISVLKKNGKSYKIWYYFDIFLIEIYLKILDR